MNDEWLAALSATERKVFLQAVDALHDKAQEMGDESPPKASAGARRGAATKTSGAAASKKSAAKLKKPPAVSTTPDGEVVLDQKMASQLLSVLNAAIRKRS